MPSYFPFFMASVNFRVLRGFTSVSSYFLRTRISCGITLLMARRLSKNALRMDVACAEFLSTDGVLVVDRRVLRDVRKDVEDEPIDRIVLVP